MERVDSGLDGLSWPQTSHVEQAVYYGGDRAGGLDDWVTLKGRKVLYYETQYGGSLHRPRLRWMEGMLPERKLRARIPSFYRDELMHLRRVGLGERTGRLLIAVDRPTTPRGKQLFARRVPRGSTRIEGDSWQVAG